MPVHARNLKLIGAAQALPGRALALPVPEHHFVSGNRMLAPFPEGTALATFGMGCFWGAERKFWELAGVYSTSVGYAGGFTPNPTYREVCGGQTGHTEAVQVVFDPRDVPYETLLRLFWESHNPTQGMRQGNDIGTQYRSALYTHGPEQADQAAASMLRYRAALEAEGHPSITTEMCPAPIYYYAEDYHQQYLAKNPGGYCGLGGTGVSCPSGLDLSS